MNGSGHTKQPEPMRLDGLGRLEAHEEEVATEMFKAYGDNGKLFVSVRQWVRLNIELERAQRRYQSAEKALRAMPAWVRWVCVAFRRDA